MWFFSEPTWLDPYAPPRPESEEAPRPGDKDADTAHIYRAYLGHEKAIKRLSWINFALAVIWAPAAIVTVLMLGLIVLRTVGIDPVDYQFPKDMPPAIVFPALTAFHVGCLALNIAIGVGLRRFQTWARWADVAVAILFLVVCLAYAGDVLLHENPWPGS